MDGGEPHVAASGGPVVTVCPKCAEERDSRVLNVRHIPGAIRRYVECLFCLERYTTVERTEKRLTPPSKVGKRV